ncbi:MAG: glycosyltransferase [Candidatus Acididesulfobacter diazotrophicus]|jgi:glycosyltransferase involved in cell wall biosynthesis|uniref:Glycosyltransferase n=1 Tax=Candidatus Acididesulfobacter diazotrophicus TaxID=2597226 RepID=A0A519BJZ4_9DELT|nr:MAG: glycosyltransferase [Candidatus Acididesulfobacter diazotrophicus]
MKIGLIAPSPIPFTVGGAEKFYWGLQEYINKNTAHQCELIKIPVKEDNFWNLIESYYKFYSLDVSYFDAVITSKYPAWMMKHDNQHIYMLHCLRGLYDAYNLARLPVDFNSKHPKVKEILNYIKDAGSESDGLFQMLFDIKKDKTISDDVYGFPGPFIKKIINFLDRQAMKKVKSFSAISKTVAGRKEYFPDNKNINVIYPPSNLTNFKNESYKYFFTVSRLDEAKRIRMIIEAYLKADVNIPLKIAGTGPLMQELQELSKDDSRIEFLGFISDEDLINYYANAFAVIFIPYEEDYGLVTVEAMMSEKAVITFEDSGGVKEFVEDGKTGFISKPSIELLKENIEKANENVKLVIEMGQAGKKRVENITWGNTFNSLNKLIYPMSVKTAEDIILQRKDDSLPNLNQHDSINDNILRNKINKRKKITLATTYPIYPPRGGGQNRIFYLYKELANYFDIELITLTGEDDTGFRKEIAPNLVEIRVPKSKKYAEKELQIQQKIGIFATDITMLYFYDDAIDYAEAIKKSADNSDCLISSQAYVYHILKKYANSFLIYESQNVEYELKKQMVLQNNESEKILSELFEAEKEVCLDSDLITVCAIDDAYKMQKLYGLDLNRTVEVPNGADLKTVKFVPLKKRQEIKNKLGLEKEKIILFIGSWHRPNIDAAEKIIDVAKKLTKYKFVILGGISDYFKNNKIAYPSNVGFTGMADDYEKDLYLSIADLAINPMMSGSGTNLKMLDYMAAGIPVLSTLVGARGLKLNKRHDLDTEQTVLNQSSGHTLDKKLSLGSNFDSDLIQLANMEDFSDAVTECLENYNEDKIYKALKHVELNFDWKIIAEEFKNKLAEII